MAEADEKIKRALWGLQPEAQDEPPKFTGLPTDIQHSTRAAAKQESDERSAFIKQNFKGVPIDLDADLPASIKFQASLRATPDDQLAFLNKHYREQNPYFYSSAPPARMASDGTILVRLPTESGSIDVPLNAEGFSASDLASFAGDILPTASSVAAMLAARKVPVLKRWPKLKGSVSSAAGAAATGGVQDAVFRGVDQGASNIGATEIAMRRMAQMPVDMAFDGAIALGGNVLKRVISPGANMHPAQVDLDTLNAREYFLSKYGVDYPLTWGEKTGNLFIKRTEASMSKLPGSAGVQKDVREEKAGAFNEIQEKMLGDKRGTIPHEEAVGEMATAQIKGKTTPLVESVEQKNLRLVTLANQRIADAMDSAFPLPRQVMPERVGGGIRAKVVAEYDALQAQSKLRYEAMEQLPGGSDRILSTPGLQKRASDLLDKLASVEVTKSVPTGVLSPTGQPIMAQQQVVERLKEYLPEGVDAMLTRMASLDPSAKFALRDLIRARGGLDNKISKEAANIPTKRLRELTEIRKMLDDSINEAVDSIPDKRLKTMYHDTNQWYAKERQRFDDVTIQRLFHDFDKAGGIRDEDIVRNIGLSEYQVLKKFLGDSSPEFQALRRSIADSVIEASTNPSGMVEGKALMKELSALYKNKRSIAEDAFGQKGKALGGQLQRLGELLSDSEAMIDASKFSSLLSGDRPLAQAVKESVDAQKKLRRQYRSGLVKQVAEGKLDNFDAANFVDMFYNAASPKEVKAVLDLLDSDGQQRVRQKVIERIFYEAQRAAKDVDTARLGSGEVFRQPNTSALDRVFGNDAKRERLRAALGPDTFKDFDMLAKLLRSGEVSEQAFISMGGMSAGTFTAGMVTRGPFQYAGDWAKQRLVAIATTLPIVRQYASNTLARKLPIDEVAMGLIGLTPVLQALESEAGPGMTDQLNRGTEEMLHSLARSVERWRASEGGVKPAYESEDQRRDRIRRVLAPTP